MSEFERFIANARYPSDDDDERAISVNDLREFMNDKALVPTNRSWWVIYFDDADRKPEVFGGEGAENAAKRRYEQISISWNAHLFVKVDSNSRDFDKDIK